MKKIIFCILFLFLVSGCSLFKNGKCDRLIKKERRVLNKIKSDCKECIDSLKTKVKLDSIIPEQNISGSIKLDSDTGAIDSIITFEFDSIANVYGWQGQGTKSREFTFPDSSGVVRMEKDLQKKINTKIKERLIISKPVSGDTLDIKFRFWQEGSELKYLITKKKQEIHVEKEIDSIVVNCPELPVYKNPWFWAFIGTVFVLILVLIKK